MNIVMDINNINPRNIFLGNNIKNNIIENGSFYKLKYSNQHFTLNNIVIGLDITSCTFLKNYNRYKCVFNYNKYNSIINKISVLENMILSKIHSEKQPQNNIATILQSGALKLPRCPSRNEKVALKVSGVWETERAYGLTYKFIIISTVIKYM